MNIIVITDGKPLEPIQPKDYPWSFDSQEFVASVIKKAAERLDELGADEDHVGMQFFQVGMDEAGTNFLKWLDDELHTTGRQHRDIVDRSTFTAEGEVPKLSKEGILKILKGGIDRKTDFQEARDRRMEMLRTNSFQSPR